VSSVSSSVRAQLEWLNEEASQGGALASELLARPIPEWERLVNQNRSYLRWGTLMSLLDVAREALDRRPVEAEAIARFVCAHAEAVAPDPENTFDLQLRGNAWKEVANALKVQKDYDGAADAIRRSVGILALDPLLVVDHANARFVQAHITHEQQHTDEAIIILQEAVTVFAEHAQPVRYLYAVELLAAIVFDQGRFGDAAHLFRVALSEAERLHDEREQARALNGIGQCSVHLGLLEDAAHFLTRAFLAFTTLKMDVDVARSIWGIARVAMRRGDLTGALDTLQGVYAQFLQTGLPFQAARVLVEISDVIVKETADLALARRLCATLRTTMGAYDAASEVRQALDYLWLTTEHVASPDEFARALGPVREFVEHGLASPSTIFLPPPMP
jgi:tetratricopeptide (TPR) repeat protein